MKRYSSKSECIENGVSSSEFQVIGKEGGRGRKPSIGFRPSSYWPSLFFGVFLLILVSTASPVWALEQPGLSVPSFLSNSQNCSAETVPLLEGWSFHPTPLSAEPSLTQVARVQTPTGLLAFVPAIDAEARKFIEAKTREVENMAMDFALEFPNSHLLPFQLDTVETNLYWAPSGLQTGRLLLREYTGGAHGNLSVGSWTTDAAGNLLALEDVLELEPEEALEAIVRVAIEHRRNQDRLGLTVAEIEEEVRAGLPNLAAVDAWNPAIRDGTTGLWITLLPYTIAAYSDGIQEFFLPMPLATGN